MAKVEKFSVALPAGILDDVRRAVANGEYASASEVVRDALRDWKAKRNVAALQIGELRRLIQEGIESGPGLDADLVFTGLRRKYASMADE